MDFAEYGERTDPADPKGHREAERAEDSSLSLFRLGAHLVSITSWKKMIFSPIIAYSGALILDEERKPLHQHAMTWARQKPS